MDSCLFCRLSQLHCLSSFDRWQCTPWLRCPEVWAGGGRDCGTNAGDHAAAAPVSVAGHWRVAEVWGTMLRIWQGSPCHCAIGDVSTSIPGSIWPISNLVSAALFKSTWRWNISAALTARTHPRKCLHRAEHQHIFEGTIGRAVVSDGRRRKHMQMLPRPRDFFWKLPFSFLIHLVHHFETNTMISHGRGPYPPFKSAVRIRERGLRTQKRGKGFRRCGMWAPKLQAHICCWPCFCSGRTGPRRAIYFSLIFWQAIGIFFLLSAFVISIQFFPFIHCFCSHTQGVYT